MSSIEYMNRLNEQISHARDRKKAIVAGLRCSVVEGTCTRVVLRREFCILRKPDPPSNPITTFQFSSRSKNGCKIITGSNYALRDYQLPLQTAPQGRLRGTKLLFAHARLLSR
ncbi:hypothetical protein OIU78_002963 [Salix suchowensis]|nr:hypothetical protein OIU78_002963 [Salix suchowensis]